MAMIIKRAGSVVHRRWFNQQAAILQIARLATEDELAPLIPLLDQIKETEETEGKFPFIIVPQNPKLTLAWRMAKVALKGKTGVYYLSDSRMTNLDNIPKGHYLMVDVEDGRATINIKPSVYRRSKGRRFGGTAVEGITMVTYKPEILRHHYLELVGSSYGECFPCLFINGDQPWFSAVYGDNASPSYGSLSCGRRLGLSPA